MFGRLSRRSRSTPVAPTGHAFGIVRRTSSTRECGRTALWSRRSAEFLGESDEKPLRPADVAEPVRVFIPDHFAHELRTALRSLSSVSSMSSTTNMTRRYTDGELQRP